MQFTNTIFANRYRLIRKIGSGGFADVWQAADQMAEDTVVAVKIYVPDRGMDDRGIKQFRREYAGFMGLNHPNLLTARYFDIWEGRPYLIMPYIRGGSLADRLTDTGPLKEAHILNVLQDVGSALAYLHRKEILHQDIKPDNILIGDDGEYLLTDFGISGRLRATLHKQTGSKTSLTIAYAAPERFDAMPRSLPASDIFSLGVLTYELATGEVPWMGNGGMSLKQGAEVPVLYPSTGSGLSKLMGWMLSVDPHKRPAAEEVRKAAAASKVQPPKPTAARETRRTVRIEDINPTASSAGSQSSSGEKAKGSDMWKLIGVILLLVVLFSAAEYFSRTETPAESLPSVPPVVTGAQVVEITGNSALVRARVTSATQAGVTDRGICYSTLSNPALLRSTCISTGTGFGAFSRRITGLLPGRTYYVRAYAINAAGTSYSEEVRFNTINEQDEIIQISNIDQVTASNARVTGNISVADINNLVARGVCYSRRPNPGTSDMCYTLGLGAGPFSVTLLGLEGNTSYYVRAFVTKDNGTSYSNEKEFRTNASLNTLVVSTNGVSSISTHRAVISANITGSGNSNVTRRGVCYSTLENPTINDSCVSSGTGTGLFSVNLVNLQAGTRYYARAFARSASGTQYGNELTFVTEQPATGNWPRDNRTTVVEVRNPVTGRIWMDRNLGASRAARSPTDEEAFGDLYQWGRAADGHQRRNSGSTSNLSSSNNPGHGNFILSNSSANWDWRRTPNDQLWQGVNGINNPCPVGFRLPTKAEWDDEMQSWRFQNAAGAFESPLRLTLTGFRNRNTPNLLLNGTIGYFWSSSKVSSSATGLHISGTSSNTANSNRAFGRAVRCIKD